jgi:hypothetical protein
MSANPHTRFFWKDWEYDPALRLCSLAAQGLWMRLLCIAARANPVGYLVIDGRPCTDDDIARLAGEPVDTVRALLDELERNCVFSRTRKGIIYNRRMTRDAKRSAANRENGQKGGAVTAEKQKDFFRSSRRHTERPPKQTTERPPKASYSPTSPDSPITTQSPPPSSPSAQRVVVGFVETRKKLYPNEDGSRLDVVALSAEAQDYLDSGASEQLCSDVIDRTMQQFAKQGRPAPRTLRFCHCSIRDAVAVARRGGSGAGSSPQVIEIDLARDRAVLASFIKNRVWRRGIGPSPLEPGCRLSPQVLDERRAELDALAAGGAA